MRESPPAAPRRIPFAPHERRAPPVFPRVQSIHPSSHCLQPQLPRIIPPIETRKWPFPRNSRWSSPHSGKESPRKLLRTKPHSPHSLLAHFFPEPTYPGAEISLIACNFQGRQYDCGAQVSTRILLSTTADAFSSRPRAGVHNRGRLLQVLGVWFGISAAVGNAIGAGIVYTPGDIGKGLPNAWFFIGVWVVGGLYALAGASSMAELGAAIPRSGGQYNFSRRALGEYPGFIVGWSDWLSTCGTAASVSLVVSDYMGHFFPVLAGPFKIKIVSVLIIAGFGILQWRGIRWGSSTQLFTAGLKTAAFLVLVLACFIRGGASHAVAVEDTASQLTLPSGWPLVVAVLIALQAVIYTIDGWDGVIYFGAEVKNPGRDMPRAIFGSVACVMSIYLL